MAGMSPLGQLDASPRGPAISTTGATQSSANIPGQMSPTGTPNPDQQFRSLQQQLYVLNDTTAKEELRLKAAQELSDNLDVAIASPHYQQFLDSGLRVFLKILKELPNHSIAEYSNQQTRKLVLEMIQRLPANDNLKPHAKDILVLMFKLLEYENEENVLVCLRIIIELHKQFRPQHSMEITHFLQFVKSIYKELPNHLTKIFEPKQPIKVKDLSELNVEALLGETFTTTTITIDKKGAAAGTGAAGGGDSATNPTYNLIPKAVLSLKVLQELPIIVVLMYQLYKQFVHSEVAEFIPLIMNTITLQPTPQQRAHKDFNKEVFVDFMGAQIKTLSFLAYIIRIYQEVVSQHSGLMVKGMLSLLTVCPHEVAHLRKELLIAARHILATELRVKFVPHMEKLFDENILLGTGWTTHESLRPLAYSTLADLVHHVRQLLPLSDLTRAVQLFSRNVHDESLPTSIQTMSCKLLLNLVECIRTRSEHENTNGRALLMRMMEVFVLKFKTVAKLQLPVLMAKHKGLQALSGQSPIVTTSQGSTQITNNQTGTINVVAAKTEPGVETKPEIKNEPSKQDTIQTATPSSSGTPSTVADQSTTTTSAAGISKKCKFGFPASQAGNYSVADCRALVKTLVCGVKTITWGCTSCKQQEPGASGASGAAGATATVTPAGMQQKQFQPKETLVYIRLVKWAMEALDIYTLNTTATGQPLALQTAGGGITNVGGIPRSQPMQQAVRTKEEKEVLEHFAGVFSLLHPQTFKEVFSQTIDYVVERIYKNYALQIMANSFLANNVTSPIFATILVEYLLERMHEMGSNMERSNLYLKLFKLVFGSVSLFAAENELMLKPHLSSIVNKSMELAKSAKEPYNYFLLLRALFRSIGGGSHDLLYQEFLPLLPNLLQGLNSLQSGLHKQHMKDLFVELCLTVPVRLSSLLPYLPMLMDPLVSALNGSQTLVSQGLRTLELCVDNLQPDFLYEHIQPVRAELMQALWRTLRNPSDQVAHVAFRVLGKFGGGNRKMMIEPQALEYAETEDPGPSITIHFPDHEDSIALPVKKVIETAFNALKSSSTEPGFYRKQCWEVIKCYLVSSLNLDDEKGSLVKLMSHQSFKDSPINSIASHYKCPDKQAREVHQMAVTGMFVAAAIKELRQSVLSTMVALVRHYTMVAIAQQAGPLPLDPNKQAKLTGMDPLVLIDALAVIMGHQEKELCKPGHLAMVFILDTATNILGSKERACRLPLMEYMAEQMCNLCYERAWYGKLGGCIAIKFLFERMDLRWVFQHQFSFLKALLFIMMDLTGEVSSGAVDMAKLNLEKMLKLCASPITMVATNPEEEIKLQEMKAIQQKSLYDVIRELVRQVTSPNTYVREQAISSLQVLAEIQGKPITEVMLPHKDVLQDMIPPKKHLLRHQPVNAQIGLMDGNTFCTTLNPRLFTIDLKVIEHKVFFTELLSLCENDDASLQKLSCYKSITNLVPLRKSALRALSACHYIPECRDKIFHVLYKALNNSNTEICEAAYECMQKFISGFPIDMEIVQQMMRTVLQQIQIPANMNLNLITRLYYFAQLFPQLFNQEICEVLLKLLKYNLEHAIRNMHAGQKAGGQQFLKVAAAIIKLFEKIPPSHAPQRIIEMLCKLVLTTERALMMEPGSNLREPLMKYLVRFPSITLDYFTTDITAKEAQNSRFLIHMLNHKENGESFRTAFSNKVDRLAVMASSGGIFTPAICNQNSLVQMGVQQPGAVISAAQAALNSKTNLTNAERSEIQFVSIRVVHSITKANPDWIKEQHNLISTLKVIWNNETYHTKHKNGTPTTPNDALHVDYSHWKEPKLIVKVLLQYFKHHQDTEIMLLFQLLRALCGRFIADFQFLKDFLEKEVCEKYPVEWKRAAFFEFVKLWKSPITDQSQSSETLSSNKTIPQELKGKILQYVIIPAFAFSFDKGDGDKLIGSPPAPDQEDEANVVSTFILDIIDPENPFGTSDTVRILLLQFSCLLVDQGATHIHDAGNKKQGKKLRRLMTYAWPCLLSKNCVDPATRYHGHLLLSHIIAKFAIHKRIVLQVFHSLLKAHAVEARSVVRQALEILTPSMPGRMEDGNTMLNHWTKKIIVEDGHAGSQLVHILQLVVKHYKVYYPVRHHLIQHIVTSIQRLGFTATATGDQKRLAVDLCEIAIKWEIQRVRDEISDTSQTSGQNTNTASTIPAATATAGSTSPGSKRSQESLTDNAKRPKLAGATVGPPLQPASGQTQGQKEACLDKVHCDSIVNYLLRLACQVNDSQAGTGASPGEMLSRRCVNLLKMALKPDIWPNCDLKLGAFEKILAGPQGVDSNQPNYVNICTCLDILSFLLTILRKDQILTAFKPLQKSIATCMTCPNSKVIRAVHTLMSRLMNTFPTEPTNSPVASKYEELEQLYASVGKVIYEGLNQYDKNMSAPPSSLFGTLMMLKAACINNACYIDRLITSFMRVLQRMAREHLAPTTTENTAAASELLILSLDLVKNRVAVMGQDMRKAFIGAILVGLIEKSPDVKVMKAITKMLEDWMKNKDVKMVNQGPNLKEKSILLVKLMTYVEKRFQDDSDLNAQFLDLINFVYREDYLRNSELTSKLEPAFLSGLRCVQPHIRAKFFEVFDTSMRKKLHDRLLYVVCSQNWEHMGPHYWIKQIIELMLATATPESQMTNCTPPSHLPAITTVISMADPIARDTFNESLNIKMEPADISIMDMGQNGVVGEDAELAEIELASNSSTEGGNSGMLKKENLDSNNQNLISKMNSGNGVGIGGTNNFQQQTSLNQLIARQFNFLESVRDYKTLDFLTAMSQLAHMDHSLAENVWLNFFPRVWSILSDAQRETLAKELVPFVCSGAHVIQKDCQPSALNTFLEALSLCQPAVYIKPALLKYLGKSHNLWHRSTLLLEQIAFGDGSDPNKKRRETAADQVYEFDQTSTASRDKKPQVASSQQEAMDALSEMYSLLKEEDMWAGLWQKKAKYNETNIAISYEQQGYFEQAQGAYELAMSKYRNDYSSTPSPVNIQQEVRLWEQHWLRSSKELNQWEILLEYGDNQGSSNAMLVLESAWRSPNWQKMKDALTQVELAYPKEMGWRINLYRGYLAICHPEETHLPTVDRYVEMASGLCIKEWRRLPHIVSHIHLPFLQAAQQVMELNEAAQIHQGLLHGKQNSLHDMKAIVKTWRNRLPVISDDLSHWSEIFTWRQHHYQFIANHYNSDQMDQTNNQSMLGVHASAQAIIHFGKIARKQNLTSVCLESLSRIYTIASVPIVDCFQKIRQQVKCYVQTAATLGKNELQEGLDVIESTNLKYFTKDMTAEFYALKGMLLAQIGKSDDANKAFSAAVQMHDTLVKAWALWGDYLESIFTNENSISGSSNVSGAAASSSSGNSIPGTSGAGTSGTNNGATRNIKFGVEAITCYLHACRHNSESKSRKYLAKVLWLLTYDDENLSLAEAVDKYNVGVPAIQWLPWIPQLLTCLARNEGKPILNLLSTVGRMFPQAVYFPIRTLYLTLKIEQRERFKTGEITGTGASGSTAGGLGSERRASDSPSNNAVGNVTQADQGQPQTGSQGPQNESGPIRATQPMWRCSRIMHMQRDLHPTVLSSLEGIVDQMVWFRENWYEEVLRQLRQGLAKCHVIAFDNRAGVNDATITPHTLNFVKKLVSTFGIGIENFGSGVAAASGNVGSINSTGGSGSVNITAGVSSSGGSGNNANFSSAASESLVRRAQATAQDPVFQKMKSEFSSSFDFSVPGATKLHNLIQKLKKWINLLEAKTKILPKSFLIEEKCRFLSNFSRQTAEVELPGELLLPKHSHYQVCIQRFMPRVEIVQKHNAAARRLYIRGHNGKIYPYLVVSDSGLADARREERVLQLLRMMNQLLGKHKETSKRFLNFTVPRVVAVSPQMRLVEDNPSSVSLLDIYKSRCAKRGLDHDNPIAHYYKKLGAVQARGSQASHQVLREILREVQTSMVPRTMLKEWAMTTFPSATDYWTFRKMFTLQLALAGFAEYVLHLSRLNPDMMYIHQDSGLVNVSYFKFDVDDVTGELDSTRPVPFRMTPNVAEFVTSIGVNGPLTSSMIAAGRCFVQPSFKIQAILRAVLRDEMIAWSKKNSHASATSTSSNTSSTTDNQSDNSNASTSGSTSVTGTNPQTNTAGQSQADRELIIQMVTKAEAAITQRLTSLSLFDGTDSKVGTLVANAHSADNLCRMDPAWHPWL